MVIHKQLLEITFEVQDYLLDIGAAALDWVDLYLQDKKHFV